MDLPFKGCLRNLSIRKRHPGEPTFRKSIEPCTEATEPGFAFYPNAGYMKLCKKKFKIFVYIIKFSLTYFLIFTAEKFKVGRRIKINLQIKPRTPSGILLVVHGEKDYMVLQMVNGTIKFTVDNGRAPLSSSFSTQPYDLCDGRWHSVQGKYDATKSNIINETYFNSGLNCSAYSFQI